MNVRLQYRLQAIPHLLPLFLALDALGDADVRLLWQVHQVAAGKADLGGEPGAFGADWILDYLHDKRLSFMQHLLDAAFCLVATSLLPDVSHMQKSCTFEADVDEGGLHAREHARNPAKVDVSNKAAAACALYVQFLNGTQM